MENCDCRTIPRITRGNYCRLKRKFNDTITIKTVYIVVLKESNLNLRIIIELCSWDPHPKRMKFLYFYSSDDCGDVPINHNIEVIVGYDATDNLVSNIIGLTQ